MTTAADLSAKQSFNFNGNLCMIRNTKTPGTVGTVDGLNDAEGFGLDKPVSLWQIYWTLHALNAVRVCRTHVR